MPGYLFRNVINTLKATSHLFFSESSISVKYERNMFSGLCQVIVDKNRNVKTPTIAAGEETQNCTACLVHPLPGRSFFLFRCVSGDSVDVA